MKEKCPLAFRKRGDVSLHCMALKDEKFSYCAHQYYCNQTRRWEASPKTGNCKLRKASS